jgi:putative FmdB family regulatory protein
VGELLESLYHIDGRGFVDPLTDFCLTGLVPIYEYECRQCGHRFEVIQKISDSPIKKCEKCKGKTDRLISSPAIQFKGSGWYVDGYSKKDASSGASEAKESSTTAESKDSGATKDKSVKEGSSSDSKPKSSKKKTKETKQKAGSTK